MASVKWCDCPLTEEKHLTVCPTEAGAWKKNRATVPEEFGHDCFFAQIHIGAKTTALNTELLRYLTVLRFEHLIMRRKFHVATVI